MATRGPKTSKALFRDCLRLIAHMAGTSSPKALHLRTILKSQFLANAHITDPAKLHSLKQGCVGGGLDTTLSFLILLTAGTIAHIFP